jgi:hypothetical protein
MNAGPFKSSAQHLTFAAAIALAAIVRTFRATAAHAQKAASDAED